MEPVLFIHVPKTAGTSFREEAARTLGKKTVELDYGPDAEDTTALLRTHIYGDTSDPYSLYRDFVTSEKTMLAGHFGAGKYGPLFGASNCLTFLRAPLERAVSEYLHFKRHRGYDQPFGAFIENPAYINRQSQFLGQFPWRAFGMVGISERYGASLALINARMGWELRETTKNVGTNYDDFELTEANRGRFLELNKADIQLYEDADAYLHKRQEARAEGRDFIFHHLAHVPETHVMGWAFSEATDAAPRLGLYLDDRLIMETCATEYREALACYGVARGGYCGFRFNLRGHALYWKLEVRALESEQSLLVWKRR